MIRTGTFQKTYSIRQLSGCSCGRRVRNLDRLGASNEFHNSHLDYTTVTTCNSTTTNLQPNLNYERQPSTFSVTPVCLCINNHYQSFERSRIISNSCKIPSSPNILVKYRRLAIESRLSGQVASLWAAARENFKLAHTNLLQALIFRCNTRPRPWRHHFP